MFAEFHILTFKILHTIIPKFIQTCTNFTEIPWPASFKPLSSPPSHSFDVSHTSKQHASL